MYRDIEFDTSYRVAFVREESSVRFYLDDELIGEYPYEERGEYFFVRAMNEVNQPFSTYLENVRVLRTAIAKWRTLRKSMSQEAANGPVLQF